MGGAWSALGHVLFRFSLLNGLLACWLAGLQFPGSHLRLWTTADCRRSHVCVEIMYSSTAAFYCIASGAFPHLEGTAVIESVPSRLVSSWNAVHLAWVVRTGRSILSSASWTYIHSMYKSIRGTTSTSKAIPNRFESLSIIDLL